MPETGVPEVLVQSLQVPVPPNSVPPVAARPSAKWFPISSSAGGKNILPAIVKVDMESRTGRPSGLTQPRAAPTRSFAWTIGLAPPVPPTERNALYVPGRLALPARVLQMASAA